MGQGFHVDSAISCFLVYPDVDQTEVGQNHQSPLDVDPVKSSVPH